MKRLALLPIETSDDGRLCAYACPLLDVGSDRCGRFGKLSDRPLVHYPRHPACLSATAQADRLGEVRDAASGHIEAQRARFVASKPPSGAESWRNQLTDSERRLDDALAESTRAETENAAAQKGQSDDR